MFKPSETGSTRARRRAQGPARLHDKQSERDHRELRIDKVGVRGLRFPVQVRDKAHAVQNTVATVGLFVDLPKEFKGTHMSRFIEVLNAHGNIVHVENIPDILYAMQKKFQAATSHLEMEFPYFMVKQAPVSGMEGVMKPHPRIFQILCERHRIVPETGVFIDDVAANAAAASALGIHGIHFRSPAQLRSELVALGMLPP